MPVYRCNTPAGTLSQDQRDEIATAIADIHSNATGAPTKFVQVLFFETPEANDSGYPSPHFIDASIRTGRPPETRQAITDGLTHALSTIGGVPRDSIGVKITDSPASWSMEAGQTLPEPGQESAEGHTNPVAP